jgi:hypothetical protein
MPQRGTPSLTFTVAPMVEPTAMIVSKVKLARRTVKLSSGRQAKRRSRPGHSGRAAGSSSPATWERPWTRTTSRTSSPSCAGKPGSDTGTRTNCDTPEPRSCSPRGPAARGVGDPRARQHHDHQGRLRTPAGGAKRAAAQSMSQALFGPSEGPVAPNVAPRADRSGGLARANGVRM